MRILQHLVEVDSVLIIGLKHVTHPGHYLQIILLLLVPPGMPLNQLLLYPLFLLSLCSLTLSPFTIRAHAIVKDDKKATNKPLPS